MTTDLDALRQNLIDLDDDAVCGALADLLTEQGHPVAELVRQFADARPAFPEVNPLLGPGQRFAVYPLACSGWWVIELRVVRSGRKKAPVWLVTIRFYYGAETLLRLEEAGVYVDRSFSLLIEPPSQSRDNLALAFDAVRRSAIVSLLGKEVPYRPVLRRFGRALADDVQGGERAPTEVGRRFPAVRSTRPPVGGISSRGAGNLRFACVGDGF